MIYEVVSDMDASRAGKEVLCIMPKSIRQRDYIYKYEPLVSCDTFEEAQNLMSHIQSIGIQTYFDEIVAQAKLEKMKSNLAIS